MSALTLTNGNAGEGGSGGAIYTDGTLDLTDVRLSANRAGKDGGAIYASDKSPAVSLTDCDLTSNEALFGYGGAINQQAGTLTITGGNVNLNKASSTAAACTRPGRARWSFREAISRGTRSPEVVEGSTLSRRLSSAATAP